MEKDFLLLCFKTASPTTYYFMTNKIYLGSARRYHYPLNNYTSLFIPSVSWINKQAFIYSGYLTLNWITKSLEGSTRNYCSYQRANWLIMHFMCLISTNKILIFMGKMSCMRDNTIFVKARYIFAKERAFDHNFSMCCCLLTVPSCCLWHSALTIQKRPVL